MKKFSIIAAVDQNMGIGKDGHLPWYLPEDMKYFSKITKHTDHEGQQNAVIMGYNTWKSLPDKFKPLPGRFNVVLSYDLDVDLPEGVLLFGSLDEALTALDSSKKIDQAFIIGGGKLYSEAILHDNLERLYLTRIEGNFDCDTFFPEEIPDEFEVISATEILEDEGIEFSFVVLERTDPEPEEL